MLSGENGILRQATEGNQKYKTAQNNEKNVLNEYEEKIEMEVTQRITNVEELREAIMYSKDGDTIFLASGHFNITGSNNDPLVIDKSIKLVGATAEEAHYDNSQVITSGNIPVSSGTLFTRAPNGDRGITNLVKITAEGVTLKNITFDGAICNDDGSKSVYSPLTVEASDFIGENLYFNNMINQGIELNNAHNAKLKNIVSKNYFNIDFSSQKIVNIIASKNVFIDGLNVTLNDGVAVRTNQQTVIATINNLEVSGTGTAVSMNISNTPSWWQPDWGSYMGNHIVTLTGATTLGENITKVVINDESPDDEYTATFID